MSIKSESQFLFNLIKLVLKSPFYLVLSLFNREHLKEALMPFREVFKFLFEAKITFYLIVINILVFIYEIFFLTEEALLSIVQGQMELQIIPIISSWFLHAGIAHLFGNVLVLFIFGRVVERKFKAFHYLSIYLGGAVIASIFSIIFNQPGIGASGAISGMVSTAILISPFYITYIAVIPLPILFVGWLAIIADISGVFTPVMGDNVGHFAHLGGYMAISLIVFLFSEEKKEKMKKGLIINIVFVGLLLLLKYLHIINL